MWNASPVIETHPQCYRTKSEPGLYYTYLKIYKRSRNTRSLFLLTFQTYLSPRYQLRLKLTCCDFKLSLTVLENRFRFFSDVTNMTLISAKSSSSSFKLHWKRIKLVFHFFLKYCHTNSFHICIIIIICFLFMPHDLNKIVWIQMKRA